VRLSFFIGTKAQYIKTAPLIRIMIKENVPFRLIDTGQHAAFTKKLRQALEVPEPDVTLKTDGNIVTILQAAQWFLYYCFVASFRPGWIKRELFPKGPGICVIHGDTPSTLLSLVLAKRAGQKVAHLEAGLRSYNWLSPFPEEIIRVLCMRFSDYLFAPSSWAVDNIKAMGISGKVIGIGQNTNIEALYYSLSKSADRPFDSPYAVMNIHRVETILSKERLTFVAHLVRRLSKNYHVIFVLHEPTAVKLKAYGLRDMLEHCRGVSVLPLIDHPTFVQLVDGAEFVITDGGSIQEECSYLDVPCLVMRTETERQEGVGETVRLGQFDEKTIDGFLADYKRMRQGKRVQNHYPSKIVFNALCIEAGVNGSSATDMIHSSGFQDNLETTKL